MAKEARPTDTSETLIDAESTQTRTVSLEAYEALYNQAVDLEMRYKRLFNLYTQLLDSYLNQK